MVARLRGVQFRFEKEEGVYEPADNIDAANFDAISDLDIAEQALEDVAKWLGYRTADDYNDACQCDPDVVRQRLKRAE